jgi:hypothetical protein
VFLLHARAENIAVMDPTCVRIKEREDNCYVKPLKLMTPMIAELMQPEAS